jgi:Flp pilus assembly protein TadD
MAGVTIARSIISGFCLLLIGSLALGGAAAEEPAASLSAADAAFDAGDHSRALELYDEVLAGNPTDVHALVRSGLLLSWESRFDEAVQRYDRALAVDAVNRTARRERAKVLSWDRRFAESIDAFAAYLEDYPDDSEARLGLARCLSWDRRFEESREQYALLLGDDPADVSSLIGTAQTYAWSGDHSGAREWFQRALELEPDNRVALMGLGYVDLWSGESEAALRRAEELERRFPDDEEVAEFARRARRAGGPAIWASYDTLSDTDDNDLRTYRIGGRVGLPKSMRLSAGIDRYDMTDPTGDATIDSFWVAVRLRPGRGQSLTLSVGSDRLRGTDGETDSEGIGGLQYAWGLDRPWQVRASATRQSLRYSPTITDNGIFIDDLTVSVNGRVRGPWQVLGGAGLASFSDDNERTRAWAGFAYRWGLSGMTLDTGYRFDYMDFTEDLDNGYFDPSGFTSHMAQARGWGDYGQGGTWRFSVDAGLQSFTRDQVKTSNDFVVTLSGAVGHPVGRRFHIEAFALWGDYAAQSAAGFETWQLGLRLTWYLGA